MYTLLVVFCYSHWLYVYTICTCLNYLEYSIIFWIIFNIILFVCSHMLYNYDFTYFWNVCFINGDPLFHFICVRAHNSKNKYLGLLWRFMCKMCILYALNKKFIYLSSHKKYEYNSFGKKWILLKVKLKFCNEKIFPVAQLLFIFIFIKFYCRNISHLLYHIFCSHSDYAIYDIIYTIKSNCK